MDTEPALNICRLPVVVLARLKKNLTFQANREIVSGLQWQASTAINSNMAVIALHCSVEVSDGQASPTVR